ncbi:MAG: hypothetical protein V4733_04035 [Verrucomicrobiota bacterium]
MSGSPRILILTAAFGEGHNSAARNMAAALRLQGAEALVCDPCAEGAPHITGALGRGYRIVTTHFPKFWARIYHTADQCDFSKPRSFLLDCIAVALARELDQFNPDAVICTYPLYPYFLADLPDGRVNQLPVFTVVTDSIEINATWLRAPSDWWLVTDATTRDGMAASGVDREKIVDTGFPVSPEFSSLVPIAEDDACDPFRVLYFPTAQNTKIRRHARAILATSPQVHLTFALGKNFRHLYHRAKEIRREFPGRVRILGWTRKVPQLLNSHHLVIGKAGGATVHEAIAACCPMFIHHLVPGQEEGNLQLLEKIGGGMLADSAEAIRERLGEILDHNAEDWRTMKRALAAHGRNAGAITASRFVLNHLKDHSRL